MFEHTLLSLTDATQILSTEPIQELWSGYGQIARVKLEGSEPVIVKHICLPKQTKHPRGWATNISHQRKVKSYQVEVNFYRNYAASCNDFCRVPYFLGANKHKNETLLVLEDLDQAGFNKRLSTANLAEIELCLKWLANFHASFLAISPKGLWQKGTYWHLDTRPDEWEALCIVKKCAVKRLVWLMKRHE